jgi:cupin 2 domain-containing protein
MKLRNFFADLPDSLADELFEPLLRRRHFKLERILSTGQATPSGQWLEQEANEWVVLLAGAAGLLFESGPETLVMRPGDYIHIEAHRRHRVEWTSADQPTVWLALHYSESDIP